MIRLAMILLLLSACETPRPGENPADTADTIAPAEPASSTEAETRPDMKSDDTDVGQFEPRNFSEVMTIEATLRREPGGPPNSKAGGWMVNWLVFDDGRRWMAVSKEDIAYLDGERVRATGRTYDPSPYVAHLGAQHFEVQSIERVPEEEK